MGKRAVTTDTFETQNSLPSFQCGRLYGKPLFEGGCGKPVSFEESYRCYDCTASFHRDCIREHFHRSEQIGNGLTVRDALVECLLWMQCECGYPGCKRCRATKDARAVLKRTAVYPPIRRVGNEEHLAAPGSPKPESSSYLGANK